MISDTVETVVKYECMGREKRRANTQLKFDHSRPNIYIGQMKRC